MVDHTFARTPIGGVREWYGRMVMVGRSWLSVWSERHGWIWCDYVNTNWH